jgi:hypothetical protein
MLLIEPPGNIDAAPSWDIDQRIGAKRIHPPFLTVWARRQSAATLGQSRSASVRGDLRLRKRCLRGQSRIQASLEKLKIPI